MSPIQSNVLGRAVSRLARHKTTVVLAAVIALTSSSTAAAVSYVVLGGVNQTNATTILRSNVNAMALQVTNFDTTGGTAVKGINITVPAGRAPIAVNATAGKAINLNADLLDGQSASAFLPVNEKAANSDLLDGMDSGQFMKGGGHVEGGAVSYEPNTGRSIVAVANFFEMSYSCPATITDSGIYFVINQSGAGMDVFLDNGGTNAEYVPMAAGGYTAAYTNATGDSIHIQIHSGLRGTADIWLFTVHRPATPDCYVQRTVMTST